MTVMAMERLRRLFESVVFRRLRPVDPLYLSNRTAGQKLWQTLLIGVPCALVGGILVWMLTGHFRGRHTEYPSVHPAAVTTKLLSAIPKSLPAAADRGLDVVEVAVKHEGGTRVAGRVRNNSGHRIERARIVFDLVNGHGSRMGAVTAEIDSVAPYATASFECRVPQSAAMGAMVREIHAQ